MLRRSSITEKEVLKKIKKEEGFAIDPKQNDRTDRGDIKRDKIQGEERYIRDERDERRWTYPKKSRNRKNVCRFYCVTFQ